MEDAIELLEDILSEFGDKESITLQTERIKEILLHLKNKP